MKRTVLEVCGKMMPREYCPSAGVLFPYGHIVSDVVPLHVKHLYSIPNITKFKSDIDFLCQRYKPLHPSELERISEHRNGNSSARYFLLSFDDGMREVYDVIAPILRDKGVPAIFFLNSATIDNKRLMWRHKISLLIERSQQAPRRIPPQLNVRSTESLIARLKALRYADESILDEIASFLELDFDEYLRRVRPYLSTAQISELASSGFEFGAHSHSHPYFNQITVEDQRRQVSQSVLFIRALGVPCRYFAFPFHDSGVPTSVFKYLRDLSIVLSFGTSEARSDSVPFSFQRFALDGSNAASSIQDLLKQLAAKSIIRHLCGTDVIHRS
ncbi:MAG TPA: polysaccharide deacetylase family protein [Candidatus Acidoferrum sp.]